MILFYTLKGEYGCFCNFSNHPFELEGKFWPTSEHYYQAHKFIGTDYVKQIRLCKTPKEAANLGRNKSLPLRLDWEIVKDDIMRKAVYKKFKTHDYIKEILLSTGDEIIIEDSPIDYYWGWGANRTGKNRLGQILVEVREILRKEEN